MNANKKSEERQELIDTFNNLSPPLKKQLLTLAMVIETTQDITLSEGKQNNSKIHKQD